MIRSISYSRYFKMATPMETGSAVTPIHARVLITPQSEGPFPDILIQHQSHRAEGKAVPGTVGQHRVVCADCAEEQAAADHEKKPAERVLPLAPGDHDPHRRAGNADHRSYHAAVQLVR